MNKIYLACIKDVSYDELLAMCEECGGMSEYRKEKQEKLKQLSDKKNNLAAVILLNYGLREFGFLEKDMDCATNKWGKPYFSNAKDIHFCISHTKDAVCLMISDNECGVDIEAMRECNEKVMNRAFTNSERQYVHNMDDKSTAFTQIWTMKEAYIKAIGMGLSCELNSFSVVEDGCMSLDKMNCLKHEGEMFYVGNVLTENKQFSISFAMKNEGRIDIKTLSLL